MINLFYTNPISFGGHATMTVHLMRGLRDNGHQVSLYKVGDRSETFTRDFGYGEEYRNVSTEEAVALSEHQPSLITAPSSPKAAAIDSLVAAGIPMVIHDPLEFRHGWDWKRAGERCLVIRRSMQQYLRKAIFVKHPYSPCFTKCPPIADEQLAVSVCRIDAAKNIHVLLDANRLLPEDKRICIYGFENRIYTRYKLQPKYPEWKQSVSQYPKELWAAVGLCMNTTFMVDMTHIKGDGGGTQYTFLEAIDAGACLVLNSKWIQPGAAMRPGFNCVDVLPHGGELAELLLRYGQVPIFKETVDRVRVNARHLLEEHDAKTVAKTWYEAICDLQS